MTAGDLDRYLAEVHEPARTALQQLRQSIRQLLPDAEEGLSYGLPAFRVQGRTVAGFAAFTTHLSYLPHSGAVLEALAAELVGYERTKGSLHFTVDQPLSPALVDLLVATRLRELGLSGHGRCTSVKP